MATQIGMTRGPGKQLLSSKVIIARADSFVTFDTIEAALSDATRLAASAEFGSADVVVYELIEHRRKVCGTAPLGNPPKRRA